MTALLDSLANSFDAQRLSDAGNLGTVRREAMTAALRDGLPHPRMEAWKYTPLRALERRTFSPAPTSSRDLDGVPLADTLLADIPSPRMVFVNGRFDGVDSDLAGLPTGVSLVPLSQTLSDGTASAEAISGDFERADEVFARLNTALAEDGVILHADKTVDYGATVHLVFVGAPAGEDRAWHLRHRITLAEGARLRVVEHHLASDEHRHLGNALMQVELAGDAHLDHARVQAESTGATLIHRTDATLADNAEYRRLDLELGGSLSRHELNVSLHGAGSRVHANGVLLADGKRHLDTRLGIDHAGRDSVCDLTWRGLASDRSRAAFHGGILIRQGADGTNATLSNKNLLLSEGAEIDSQPALVIHADDVQAAHGATVGQLDPTTMFYMRSRGLPADAARSLLTAAFCRETLSVFDDVDLRESLTTRLDAALGRLESP